MSQTKITSNLYKTKHNIAISKYVALAKSAVCMSHVDKKIENDYTRKNKLTMSCLCLHMAYAVLTAHSFSLYFFLKGFEI